LSTLKEEQEFKFYSLFGNMLKLKSFKTCKINKLLMLMNSLKM